jgi:hypothetical protein
LLKSTTNVSPSGDTVTLAASGVTFNTPAIAVVGPAASGVNFALESVTGWPAYFQFQIGATQQSQVGANASYIGFWYDLVNSAFFVNLNSSGNGSIGESGKTLNLLGAIQMTGLPTSGTGGTVSSVCWSATAGSLWTDTSGTICGISAMMFKTRPDQWRYISPADALAGIMSLRTAEWQYLPEYQDHGTSFHVGLIANDVQAMNPLCGVDDNQNYSDRCVETYLAGAIQALKADNDNLRAEIEALKTGTHR